VPSSSTSAPRLATGVGDHAGNLVERGFELGGSRYLQIMHVEDDIAVVVVKPCRHCGWPPSRTSSRATWLRAIGSLRPGAGICRAPSTKLDSSAMHTNLRATAATIFSRVSAPPPPLINGKMPGNLVGAVDIDRQLVDAVRSNTSMPSRFRRWAEASELATAPPILVLTLPSSSMKKLAVEPVPTPTMQRQGHGRWRRGRLPASFRLES